MPAAVMLHKEDPKEALMKKVGSVDEMEVFHNHILVAVYIAPQQMASGLWRPDSSIEEDRHQSKVGLVLAMGPKAFKSDEKWTWPEDMAVGDWVYFRPSDGWGCTVNSDRENLCRMLVDDDVKGRLQHPDQVW